MTVEAVDALVLSGGSAFGLDAAGGVMAVLAERGRGFRVRDVTVPIVPQAILFDLVNGGDKAWGRKPPYFELGMAACEAAGATFALGTAGAGYGATTSTLKGGLGSASQRTSTGHTVGALVAVNAVGTATIGDGPHFWAAALERDGEYGGLGFAHPMPTDALTPRLKGGPAGRTPRSPSSPRTRSSPRRSASASPTPRMTASRALCAPPIRRSTGTWSSRRPPVCGRCRIRLRARGAGNGRGGLPRPRRGARRPCRHSPALPGRGAGVAGPPRPARLTRRLRSSVAAGRHEPSGIVRVAG